jgi:hypothetical protein
MRWSASTADIRNVTINTIMIMRLRIGAYWVRPVHLVSHFRNAMILKSTPQWDAHRKTMKRRRKRHWPCEHVGTSTLLIYHDPPLCYAKLIAGQPYKVWLAWCNMAELGRGVDRIPSAVLKRNITQFSIFTRIRLRGSTYARNIVRSKGKAYAEQQVVTPQVRFPLYSILP